MMRKNTIKKLVAAAAACAMMVTAAPSATFTYVNASEMLFSHSFDGGKEKWDSFQTDGGMHTLGTENGKLAVKISNVGTLNYSVQMNYGPINLYKGAKYRLKYDISCTTKRYVEAMIQQGGAPYQAYTWKGLMIDSTPQTIVQEFEMEYDTDLMSKLAFNSGLPQEGPTSLPEHTIYLDNVSLELVDSNGADMTNPMVNGDETPIVVDQVGYRANARKVAVFRNAGSQTKFSVVNAETNTEVFTGDLSAEINNSAAKENDKTGDFSKVTQAGKYYLKCGNDKSYTFEIGDSTYNKLIDDSVRMLYLQRCGVEVKDSKFSHVPCHTSKAKVLYTNNYIDVNGGWHDAGDYGRYVVPGAKSVADLLYAYELDPKMFGDNIGIPESGNGKPDILDEAKFELDWMLKMQEQDGGVHHKVSCAGFPAYIMPQEETAELIVTPVSSTATADFCAAMALASQVYKTVDPSYAQTCMAAAAKSWDYLQQHPEFNFKNPPEVTTGQYEDVSDNDERYWAACQMYRATGDSKYLEKINSASAAAKKGMNWMTVGDYGNLALLTMKDIDKSSEAYKNAKDTMIAEADKFLSTTTSDPYGASVTKYEWGSNMSIATNGVQMAIAYILTGDSKYMGGATAQLDYLLGENAVAKCFVTGYGTDSPKTPHHRPSMAVGEAMKGMLVGGVDQSLEDDAAQAYLNQAAPAKRYIDNPESYSTNEITIYWNSPLTMLLAYTDPAAAIPEKSDVVGTPLMGDVNCDGKINVFDALILKKHLLKKTTLTGMGLKNACIVAGDSGDPGIADLTTLMKFLSKELKAFPAYNPPA